MSFTAQPNGPRGFAPAKAKSGTPNRASTYTILGTYATKLYSGQPVMLGAGGQVEALASAASIVLGVFDGVEYVDINGDIRFSPYWPAPGAVATGSTVKARVFGSEGLFSVKASANLTTAQIGDFADLSSVGGVGGDDVTGKSTVELDAANTDATISADNVVVIVEISERNPGSLQDAIVQFARPKFAGIVGA